MRIYNARIYTMEGPVIESGYVDMENGRIAEVGPMDRLGGWTPTSGDFDARGNRLFPGFVDAHSHIGMWEDGLGFEGDDGNEDTDPSTPQLRAVDAINPLEHCFEEALDAGITTVITGPGSANPIGGQSCAMKTYGRRIDDMVIKAPVAMKMALGENPKSTYHEKNQAPVTRMATAAIIRQQLREAQRYMQDLDRSAAEEDVDPPELDIKCEALLPVLRGELPVHFHAHRLDDIFTALRLAKEFHLRFVIVHGTQGHMAADLLAAEGIQVLCGPVLCDRSKPELQSLTPKNPGILFKAGVQIALINDHPVIPQQYLPLCAGLAVREGLPYEAGLEAITIAPARICGIADRVGSIAAGKDADLTLFGEDPLTVAAKPSAVFAAGRRVR